MILPGTLFYYRKIGISFFYKKSLRPEKDESFKIRFNHLFEVRGVSAGYQFPVTEETPSALTLKQKVSELQLRSDFPLNGTDTGFHPPGSLRCSQSAYSLHHSFCI